MKKNKLLDVNALQVFLVAAEERSMSKAAVRLDRTQSAISQAIKTLEVSLGVILIDRTSRPLMLTPAGIVLRSRGDVIINAMQNLRIMVAEANEGRSSDLRIGLVDSMAATYGASLLQRMSGKVSGLCVRSGITPQLSDALIRRELDVVIAPDAMDDVDGLCRNRILTEDFLVIAPVGNSTINSVDELILLTEKLPLIRFNRESTSGIQVEKILRRAGIKALRRIEVDTAYTMTSMVAGGLGWGLTTPLGLIQGGEFSRRVRPSYLRFLNASRSVYIISHEGECGPMVDQLYFESQKIIQEKIWPELRMLAVWLTKHLVLHDVDSFDPT